MANGTAGARRRANGAGADHAVMRELNRSVVLDVLRRSSPVSRAAIAKETQLAKPTVSAIVDDLIADGLVREAGFGATTTEGGRPPIMLEFNARSQFFVGVHIGVRRTTVVVTDASGAELSRTDRRTPAGRPPAALDAVAVIVREGLAAARAAKGRVGAVGVCVPGLVDLVDGTCVFAPNLGWQDVPVRELLRSALRLTSPVYVHNTAQACAVAEALEGAGRGATNVALLYAGTGVGAGLIVEGRLYRGASGIAGEIGHARVPGAASRCSCGRVGCLETVASAAAVERASGRTLEALSAAAAAGDPDARDQLRAAGQQLGEAASWLVNVFNPEVLVVGGGLSEAGTEVLDALTTTVLDTALAKATDRLAIRRWSLGQDAKVRGAVLVAMQRAEKSVRLLFGGA